MRVTGTTSRWLVVLLAMQLCSPGVAEASGCAHRSAKHVAEHGGLKADSAWHESHGQLPTCDNSNSSGNNSARSHDSDRNSSKDSSDDERKSRWCRKHWYC